MTIEQLTALRNDLEAIIEQTDKELLHDFNVYVTMENPSHLLEERLEALVEEQARQLAVHAAVMRQLFIWSFRHSGEARKDARYGVAIRDAV